MKIVVKYIKKYIDSSALKEECKKMGVNFITAAVVGVFINHYVGTNLTNMLWTSELIGTFGCVLLYMGVKKSRDKQ